MRKNRITALLLSVVLAVTCSLGNVQTAQAAAVALAPEIIEIVYALLASSGAIAVMHGTSSQKKASIEKWKLDDLTSATWDVVNAFVKNSEGNYVYQGGLSLERIVEGLVGLRNSFNRYVDSYGYPELGFVFRPWEQLTEADVEVCRVNDATRHVVGYGLGVYKLIGDLSVSGVWSFKLEGVTLDGRKVTIENFASMQPRVSYARGWPSVSKSGVSYLLYRSAVDEDIRFFAGFYSDASVFSSSWIDDYSRFYGSRHFNASDTFTAVFSRDRAVGIGNPDMQSVVAALSGATGVIDTGIDCDTWAGTLGRSLADENKDVVILGGQDLANYNDVTTVREGLITGVDWADIGEPDIPIDPDAPAKPDAPAGSDSILRILKKILEWLKDILKWLKGLPALLAETIIGDGVLDWSGFQGVQLSSVFPFCIPWDLASCVRGFNVQPTEPVFVFDFAGTPLSSAGTVRYDLSRFAVVIPIIRYFIYGIFVVGLIVKTRDLIRG